MSGLRNLIAGEEMLANKVIVITGAGSGIGRATSLVFAKAGAKVFATDYDAASAG